MEQIYDSRHSGQDVDDAVDAVRTTIPNQLTQIGSNLDELDATLNGGNIPLSVTWTNGFIYNGGASTNAAFQRTELNLTNGQTITFTGGKDSTIDVYALAKKVGTKYTKIQSYAQNAAQETIVYTAPEDITIVISSGKTFTDGAVYEVVEGEINEIKDRLSPLESQLVDLVGYSKKEETIYNGTPHNHANTNAVRTYPIAVNQGETIHIITNRPVSEEGHYYAASKYYKDVNGNVIEDAISLKAEYLTQVVPVNATTTEIGIAEYNSAGVVVPLRSSDFNGYYIGYEVKSIVEIVDEKVETLNTDCQIEKEKNNNSLFGVSSSYTIRLSGYGTDTNHLRIVKGRTYKVTISSESTFTGTQLSLKIVNYGITTGYTINVNILYGSPKSWDGTEKEYTFTASVDIEDAQMGSYGSSDLVVVGNGIVNFTFRDITIDEINEAKPKTDIFSLNPDVEYLPKIANLKRATTVNNESVEPVTLLWFSDQHDNGTQNVARINDWRNHYADYIDDVLNCGDSVATKWNDNFSAFQNNGGDKMLMAIGNHDVADPNVSDNYYNGEVAHTDIYNKFMGIMDDASLGVVRPSDAATAGKCYYYKDYANIRLIVCDPVIQDSVWIANTEHDRSYYEAQCSWLTNVLNDAKTAGKAVIIASHYPSSIDENQDAEGFSYYTTPSSPSAGWIHEGFHDIVDTFISGGGEFITWLCGHVHSDRLGTVVNHTNQQIICVTTSSYTIYRNTRINNVVRSAGNKSEDAFNMISFDTVNKLIKIVRIGFNYDGFYRKIDSITLNYSTHAVVK